MAEERERKYGGMKANARGLAAREQKKKSYSAPMSSIRPDTDSNSVALSSLDEVEEIKIRLSDNSMSVIDKVGDPFRFEGGSITFLFAHPRNPFTKQIPLSAGEASVVLAVQGLGLLFVGTELISGGNQELMLIGKSKPVVLSHTITIPLVEHTLSFRNKVVTSKSIELHLSKNLSTTKIAQLATFISEANCGNDVTWSSLTAWWQVPTARAMYREMQELNEQVNTLKERNEQLEKVVEALITRCDQYEKHFSRLG